MAKNRQGRRRGAARRSARRSCRRPPPTSRRRRPPSSAAKRSCANATIRAPINGTVLTRDVEIGSPVSSILNMGSAATLVMTLGDIKQVFVRGKVDEADIGRVRLGQPARITVETFKDRKFEGRVTQISPIGAEKDNVTTFEVKVSIDNPGNELKANMTANAEIVLEEFAELADRPRGAISYDAKRKPYGRSRRSRRPRAASARCRSRPASATAPRRRSSRGSSRATRSCCPVRVGCRSVRSVGRGLQAMREAFIQTFQNSGRNKLRSFLTMFGILWGVDLGRHPVGDGRGLPPRQRARAGELGKNIAHRLGRPHEHAGRRRARRPSHRADGRRRAGAARRSRGWCASPRPEMQRGGVEVKSALQRRRRRTCTASSRSYQDIRTLDLERGRQLNWEDERQAQRVAILGDDICKQLFGDRDGRRPDRSRSTASATPSSARSATRTRTATTAVRTTTRCSCRSRRWRRTSRCRTRQRRTPCRT